MYPGDPGPPGSDCAGVILETGDNVAHLKRGDAVFGLAHGCLGTAVSGPAAMVVQMPSNLSFVEEPLYQLFSQQLHLRLMLAQSAERFVEISKRDIWSTSRFQQERGDINYALLAVDFLPPSVLNSTLQKIANELATGQIKPLRQMSHPMGSVANAMRQLSQATHVGKVVTTVDTLGDGFGQHPTLTISGGVGGLGVMLTDWISRRYSNCAINLLGRSGKVQVSSIWKQLMDSGAKIMVALVDTSSAEDIEALLQNTAAVFAPKTAILQGNFAALPIENLTLFSSVASLLGGAGQGNYAAANSCLDSSALAAQNMGFNVKAIQWGAWASSGMASESVLKRLNRIGQGLITAEQGLSAMRSILSLSMNHPRPVLTVNGFDWKTYLKNFEHPVFSPSFMTRVSTQEVKGTKSSGARLSSAKKKEKMSIEVVYASVHDAVIQVVGSDVDTDEPLMSAGLDSLGSVEFANVLAQKFSLQMPATLVFDYPSVRSIAEFLMDQVPNTEDDSSEGGLVEEQSASIQISAISTQSARPAIFVRSVNVQAYQKASARPQNTPIKETGGLVDFIKPIPLGRWDVEYADGSLGDSTNLSAQFGAFMHGIEQFDAAGYSISHPEAVAMDPQHRIILEMSGQILYIAQKTLVPPQPVSLWVFLGLNTLYCAAPFYQHQPTQRRVQY
eukprot:jgi/Picre1/33775/NNA_001254.t1